MTDTLDATSALIWMLDSIESTYLSQRHELDQRLRATIRDRSEREDTITITTDIVRTTKHGSHILLRMIVNDGETKRVITANVMSDSDDKAVAVRIMDSTDSTSLLNSDNDRLLFGWERDCPSLINIYDQESSDFITRHVMAIWVEIEDDLDIHSDDLLHAATRLARGSNTNNLF